MNSLKKLAEDNDFDWGIVKKVLWTWVVLLLFIIGFIAYTEVFLWALLVVAVGFLVVLFSAGLYVLWDENS